MAIDKQLELFDSIRAIEEELRGDHAKSAEEREFEQRVKDALEAGRVPVECIEEIPISDDMFVKTVVMKEC